MRKYGVKCGAGAREIALRYLGAQWFGPEAARRKVDRHRPAGLPVRRSLQYGRAAETAMGEEKFFSKARRTGRSDGFGRYSCQRGVVVEIRGTKGERHN